MTKTATKPRASKPPATKVARARRSPKAQPAAPAPTRSVIDPERKKAFAPSELSRQLTAAVADDKGRTDPQKLRAFAEANGLWNPRYETLNTGMQRMNIGTRLRGKVGRGEAINWPE